MSNHRQTIYKSPISILVIIVLSVFVSEALVMAIIDLLQPFPSILFEILFDSTLLILLLSPVFYYFLFRPLLVNIRELKDTDEILKKIKEDLEMQVLKRTDELRKVNEELLREIAEHKRVEESLKQEKAKAQKYLDIAEVMFVVINADQRVNLINKKGCEILGYEEHEVIGKNWFDNFVPERIKDEIKTVFGRLIAGEVKPVEYYENPVLTKSGEEKLIAWHNTIVQDEDGKIIGTLSSGEDITERKKAEDNLRKSEQSYKELAERLSNALNEAKIQKQTILKSRDAFFNMLEDITESHKELEELFINLVRAMVNALDAKSHWTRGHSERVTSYTEQIAKEMGFDEDEIKNLKLAGLLHDIGKIGTYDHLLDKPDKLTKEEFEVIKRHPVQGVEILKEIKQLKDIVPLIRHHHERLDGKGYPDGLCGEDIPLGSRILHVADSFDSMTADRPYRPTPGVEYAISELKKYAGSQFDPRVVEAFLRVIVREHCKVSTHPET